MKKFERALKLVGNVVLVNRNYRNTVCGLLVSLSRGLGTGYLPSRTLNKPAGRRDRAPAFPVGGEKRSNGRNFCNVSGYLE
jgi:hypothetical protein